MLTGYQFAQPLPATKYCLEVFRGRLTPGSYDVLSPTLAFPAYLPK
jgi:hypothetical protein